VNTSLLDNKLKTFNFSGLF